MNVSQVTFDFLPCGLEAEAPGSHFARGPCLVKDRWLDCLLLKYAGVLWS